MVGGDGAEIKRFYGLAERGPVVVLFWEWMGRLKMPPQKHSRTARLERGALLVFAHLSASLHRLADPPPFVACGDISPTPWGNLPQDALRRFAPRRCPSQKFSFSVKSKTDTGKVSVCFWRRRGDSNSRAGYPTYALSRGASSPT